MKNFKTKTKYIFILLLLGVSVFSVNAAFTGPGTSVAPETPLGFTQPLLSDKSEAVISPYVPGLNFPGRTLSLMNSDVAALVTDGIFSFGPVRAIGKLTASLIPTTLTGYPGREVMTIFGGSDSAVVSFLTNTPYLGFWSQEEYDPSFTGPDSLSQLDSNIKKITNLLFGRVNVKNLVISPSNPYATTNKNLALYGTTNLGKGNSCYIPLPSYGSTATYTSQLAEPYKCPDGYFMKVGGTDNSQVQWCQQIDPSASPVSNGACPGIIEVIPSHVFAVDGMKNEFGAYYGYNTWGSFGGIVGSTSLPYPAEAPTAAGYRSNYTLRFPPEWSGSGPSPWPSGGFLAFFDFNTDITQPEDFNLDYTIVIPAYTFQFVTKPGSVGGGGVTRTLTIPAKTYSYTKIVTKYPGTAYSNNPFVAASSISDYVNDSRTAINNFIASYNTLPNDPNVTLALNDDIDTLAGDLKTKGFLGTPIAHALPNFATWNISNSLEYWFKEKMTITKQCIDPVNPNIAVNPVLNIGCSAPSGAVVTGGGGFGSSGGGSN